MSARARSLARTAAAFTIIVVIAACGFDAVGSGDGPTVADGGADETRNDGARTDSSSDFCTAASCVVDLAADNTHTCAAIRGQRPRCWGANANGQLGSALQPDGGEDRAPKTSPSVVATTFDAVAISVGGYINNDHPFSCAVAPDRTVSCWGSDDHGQRGRGVTPGTSPASVPAPVVGVTGVAELQAGGAHACVRNEAGAVMCWGEGEAGQLGRPAPTAKFDPTPQAVPLRTATTRLATGSFHTCALFSDESIDCWGADNAGQLGRGNPGNSSPTQNGNSS